jgi:hypothetical protein
MKIALRLRRSMTLAGFVLLTATVWSATALPAAAQSFGLGPRFAFVRGEAEEGTPSGKFFGGSIRMAASKRLLFEVSLEQRSETSEDGETRVRERPIQASMLVYPVRSVFAPYLMGGYGWYQTFRDRLNTGGDVEESISTRTSGWHAGLGAELFFGKHVAIFGDYRLRFLGWGDPDIDEDKVDIPFLGGLKISHRGSMWSTGLMLYF